jgi:integrase
MATLQQQLNGKWRALVRRKGYKAKTRTFPTKTAAKTWADRIERELADQEARGERELDSSTLAQIIKWYTAEIVQFSKITSTQRGNLTRINESLGDVPASKLTAGHIIEHARRRRSGQHVGANGAKIPACGPATMNVELGYLDAVLKLARVSKLSIVGDPVAEARPALRMAKLIAKSKKRDRRPTEDELQRLYAYFEASAWRSKIPMVRIVKFAIATAKRESEITRLLRSDLDTANRTALLRDAKHPRSKVGNHKRFALLGEAWDLVQQEPVIAGEDRIFPYNSKSIGTAFTRACAALSIEDLHFHDLRHEATSRLFEQGYAIEQVASVTLHESWQELKRYTQLKPESLHRDAKS